MPPTAGAARPLTTWEIASHLPPPLAGYATISSSWQHAIESRTFAAVTAYSGRVLFGQFKAVFAAVRRRTLLRNLTFNAMLPLREEDDVIEEPPTRQEEAADGLVYTRALITLFSFLHTWEHGSGDATTADSGWGGPTTKGNDNQQKAKNAAEDTTAAAPKKKRVTAAQLRV